jgi:guanylate kinase
MIIVFTGFTASGKTTYLEALIKRNKKYKRLITYTTRPIRTNEVNGEQYMFISNDEFKSLLEQDKIISPRSYKTIHNAQETVWKYGLGKDFITDTKLNYLTIVDPVGALNLISHFGQDNVKIIYLYCSDLELYNRAGKRGDEPAEFKRRLESDKEQFVKIKDYIGLSINTEVSQEQQDKNILALLEYIGG